MSSPVLSTNSATAPEKVGCLVIHQTPDELTIRSTFTAGRWIQLFLSYPWTLSLLIWGIASIILWSSWHYQSSIALSITIFILTAVVPQLLLVASLVVEFVFPTTLAIRNDSLIWGWRGRTRTESYEFDPGELITVTSSRVCGPDHFLPRRSLVAVTRYDDEITLFKGTAAETDHLAGLLRANLGLDLPTTLSPPARARFVCRRVGGYFSVIAYPRRRPLLLLLVFITAYPLCYASIQHLNGRGTADAWPILHVVAAIIALILVGITSELSSRHSRRTHLCLSDDVLFVEHFGARPETYFINLHELSHFSVDHHTLLAHLLPHSSPSDSLGISPKPTSLLTSLRPQDAAFLLDQLTSTLSTLTGIAPDSRHS